VHKSNRKKFRGGNFLRCAHHFAFFPRVRASTRMGGSFGLVPRVTTNLAAYCTSRHTMRSISNCFPSTIHQHSRLGRSRFGQKPCDSCQVEEPGVSRRRWLASVGPRFFSRQSERSLLKPTPRSRTSDAPVALPSQTRAVKIRPSPPDNAKDRFDSGSRERPQTSRPEAPFVA